MARWWHAIEGAAKYIAGRKCDYATQRERLGICAACPRVTRKVVPGSALFLGRDYSVFFCGAPLVVTESTCGCIVAAETSHASAAVVTIDGIPVDPAGKIENAAETCPSGKFGAVSGGAAPRSRCCPAAGEGDPGDADSH